jgi:hypothetical protein
MPEKERARIGLSDVARIGVFSALALGINAPFLAVPNVEIFSLALFLSALFLGIIDGLAVAFISGIIFVLFNPNGPQTVPLVGLAQLFGFILFGLAGGLLRPLILRRYQTGKLVLLLTLVGAMLTLWFDFSTNFMFAVIFGPFWPTLIGGMGFAIIHIVSNTIIFGLSPFIIQRIWKRIGYLLPPLAG